MSLHHRHFVFSRREIINFDSCVGGRDAGGAGRRGGRGPYRGGCGPAHTNGGENRFFLRFKNRKKFRESVTKFRDWTVGPPGAGVYRAGPSQLGRTRSNGPTAKKIIINKSLTVYINTVSAVWALSQTVKTAATLAGAGFLPDTLAAPPAFLCLSFNSGTPFSRTLGHISLYCGKKQERRARRRKGKGGREGVRHMSLAGLSLSVLITPVRRSS